jgi:hypothetical protein
MEFSPARALRVVLEGTGPRKHAIACPSYKIARDSKEKGTRKVAGSSPQASTVEQDEAEAGRGVA